MTFPYSSIRYEEAKDEDQGANNKQKVHYGELVEHWFRGRMPSREVDSAMHPDSSAKALHTRRGRSL